MPRTLQESFDPRSNSIGFLRWLMAFAVIFSHAGPLAGFYGGRDLGTQISSEQSIGGVAVAGFFFLSGFLITKSRMGSSTIFRYFWRRALRIFPAWWLALLLTGFVLAPLAWRQEAGTWDGFWNATDESPWTYFFHNMWLTLVQKNIAGMGTSIPFGADHGGFDWNGSAWTLLYEFRAYIIVGLLGLFGMLWHRWIGGAVAGIIILLACMQWGYVGNLSMINGLFGNIFYLLLLAPFAFGMLFALFGDKIPIDDRLAIAAALFAGVTYAFGGWLFIGQYAFCYVLMWFAIRVTAVKGWERPGDMSYGIYIFAWPIMQFAAYFGLQDAGWLVYHLVVVVVVHILAFGSWHLIEKPALSLKNWTPRWLQWLLARWKPVEDRIRDRIVVPGFSSTRRARELEAAA